MKKMLLILTISFLIFTGFIFAGTEGTSATMLNESFEGSFPPSGWTLFSEGIALEGWQQSSAKSRTGDNSAVAEPQYLYGQKIWLVTPAINLSTAPSAKLNFYEDHDNWPDGEGINTVSVSTTSPNSASSFTTIFEMTPANHTNSGFAGNAVEIDLSAYIGENTVYIGFAYDNPASPNYQWFLDDIRVVVPSDHDAMAISIDMDVHYDPNSSVTPMATIKNEGLNTETFDVQFGYYDRYAVKTPVSTATVTNLAAGQSTQVTFSSYTFGSNKLQYYVETLLGTDMDPTNNETVKWIDSYAVLQSVVLAEEFTSTTCTYCPGCASSLDSLHRTYPGEVAIVAYHVDIPSDGDPYVNTYSEARQSAYNVNSAPNCVFNGTEWKSGGTSAGKDWSGVYAGYESVFLNLRAQYSPIRLELIRTEDGENIIIDATITYESDTYTHAENIYYALCESHIAYNWQTSMDSLHFVEREMYPGSAGRLIYSGTTDPPIGHQETDQITFTIPVGVVKEHCELISWVQDPGTKEVKAAAIINLANDPSAIGDEQNQFAPTSFALNQNFPNPFNPTTAISYSLKGPLSGQLSAADHIELSVYNSLGQRVRTLVNQIQKPGVHSVEFDAGNLASGIYYYKLIQGQHSEMRKMILMK